MSKPQPDASLRSLRADLIGSLVGPEPLRICHERYQQGTGTLGLG